MHKLSRKQIIEGLDQVPIVDILGKSTNRELTHKQKTFAIEVAKGSTGADAYRKAYKPKGKAKTIGDNASRLKADDRVKAEILSYSMALEAQQHRTAEGLRALIIQSLVQVLIDPEAKQATKVASAKVLGTVTEVALFTERKETIVHHSSDKAKGELLKQIRLLMKDSAQDIETIDADSLLSELANHATHSPAITPNQNVTPTLAKHTIPLEQSDNFSSMEDPPPSTEETPPL